MVFVKNSGVIKLNKSLVLILGVVFVFFSTLSFAAGNSSNCTNQCNYTGQTGCSPYTNMTLWHCVVDNATQCLVKQYTNCSSGYYCYNGACVNCQDQCVIGEKDCYNRSTAWTCVRGSRGCTVLQPTNCQSGYTCSGGACLAPTPMCQNQCTVGQKGCYNSTSAWTCMNSSTGACLVKTPRSCAPGTCSNGMCLLTAHTETPTDPISEFFAGIINWFACLFGNCSS